MKAFIVPLGTNVKVEKNGKWREWCTRKANTFWLEEMTFDPLLTADPTKVSYCFQRDGWSVWVKFTDVKVR